MATTIRIKKSGTASNTPASLEYGELAINYADGILFYKDALGNIQQFSSGGGGNAFETVNANGSLLIADSNTDILNIVAGTGIDITGNTITDTFTISSRLDNTLTSTSTTAAATAAAVNSVFAVATNSFAQANAAYGQANSSYTQANNAYTQANSSYTQANAAYTQANSAYGQANASFTQANAAYGQANAAFTQANAAYVQANAAYTKANAPITIKEIYSSNSTVVNTFSNISTIQFDTESGLAVVDESNNAVTIQLNSTFKYWNINGAPGLVATGLDTVNFIGDGVTIVANNNASPKSITFSVAGSGGLSNTILKSTSFTSVNSSANLTYTLPITPLEESYLFVVKNGVVLTPITDYTVSGKILTIKESGLANDAIEVRYFEQLNVSESPNTQIIVESNTVPAQTNTFILSENVQSINRLTISKNGLQLTPNLHFTVTGNTVTLNTAAEINDVLTFTNFKNIAAGGGAGLTEYSYNTTTSSVETVDEWSKTEYRSAKYQIQIESSTGYYSTDIMLIHDGSTTNLVQYGTVSIAASNVGVFSSDISGSNVRLLFTATDPTSYLTYFRTILANRASESLPTDLMTGSDSYDLMLTLPFNPTDLN